MELSGSYQIHLEKQKVWQALNDPEMLKICIPGCQKFLKNSDTEFTATATNKIGPFNATFTGEIELKDLNPPDSYKIIGSGNSPVGFASGEAEVKLEEENGVTKLIYTVEANVGGKIAQVGSRLIGITAKKMADIFFKKFSETISNKKEEKEKITDGKVPREKESINKKIIFSSLILLIIIGVIIYYVSWIA